MNLFTYFDTPSYVLFFNEQGNSESTMRSFNNEAMKLSSRGVTITVASGDDGAASDKNYCTLNSGSKTITYWNVSV